MKRFKLGSKRPNFYFRAMNLATELRDRRRRDEDKARVERRRQHRIKSLQKAA